MNSPEETNREMEAAFLHYRSQPLSQPSVKRALQGFKQLFRHADVGMIRADAEYRIYAANSSFASMLGYSSEELADLSYTELLAPGELQAAMRDWRGLNASSHRSVSAERKLRHRHGKIVVCRETLTRVDEHAQMPEFIAIYNDLTAAKNALQEVADRERELQAAVESAGRLAESVAHDLNNFLMIIACYAEIIEGHTVEERILKSIEEINGAARRATGLTERLLSFSRQEIKNLSFQR